MTREYVRGDVLERLMRLVIRMPWSGCWIWIGSAVPRGYGTINVTRTKKKYAHRLSWELHCGSIAEDLHVCHHCDTPSCINPEHLFLGSRKDNMSDCLAKGRFPAGSRHGIAKLVEADIQKIRDDAREQADIADEYGVSAASISNIKRRKAWKHV